MTVYIKSSTLGKSDVVRESLEAMAREIRITAKVMESIKSYNKT